MKTLLMGDVCATEQSKEMFVRKDMNVLFGDTLELFKNNDVTFVNLECAITESENRIKKFGPNLKSPRETADVLKALGVNLCGLSNNHIFDFGIEGARDTMKALDEVGIDYTGFGENYEDSRKNYFVEKNGEKVPDKMIYTSDAARQDSAIRLFTERGIDVAVLDQMIDVNFASYMEYALDPEHKLRLCRVDAEVDSLTSEEEAPALDENKLAALVLEATGKSDLTVQVKPLQSDSIPLMLIEDEQTRRFNDMGRIYGRAEYAMPAKYNVVLNSRSKTIVKLSEREKDERSVLLTRHLYDLAELSRQPLEAEAMTEFIRRSMEIVAMAAEM